MFKSIFLCIVLGTLLTKANDDELALHRFRGHVKKENGRFEIITSLAHTYKHPDLNVEDVPVAASWDQTYNVTGWSILEIETFVNHTDIDQAYAAGLIEGQLTKDMITMQKQNSINDICANQQKRCVYLSQFLAIQLDWINRQIDRNPYDEYWHQVYLLLVQLNGLIDGYENNIRGPRKQIDDPLGLFLFQIVESSGDLLNRLGFSDVERHDSCSALVKILPNNTEIFVSHADWSHYKTMLKVIKRYKMQLKRSAAQGSDVIPGSEMVFSSYPGTLHSIDDFYMTRQPQLTVIETTVVNYNDDLTHNIVPISVPEWMRAMVSNRLANNGAEWLKYFPMNNDGTYNNQWMIADYKLFTPGSAPKDGFLMMGEQMVTYFETKDLTQILRDNTYWASYNNVYFPDFRTISHEEDMVQKKGPQLYSWQNSSRANIFRRDHVKVVDLKTMTSMMRYNDFKNDTFSRCDCTPPYSAELTIAARCDLNPADGKYPDDPLGHRPHGATDAKIASYAMIQNFTLSAVAGPSAENQPPFVWSQSDFDKVYSHIGHPDVWNFQPISPVWVL